MKYKVMEKEIKNKRLIAKLKRSVRTTARKRKTDQINVKLEAAVTSFSVLYSMAYILLKRIDRLAICRFDLITFSAPAHFLTHSLK